MYEKIGDEIREKETLAMKMKVHDSFGRSLLSIRRILENKEEPENMEKQMETLKQLVYILTGTTVKMKESSIKIQKNMRKSLEFQFRSGAAIRNIQSTGFLQIKQSVNA